MKCELTDHSRDGRGMISVIFVPEPENDKDQEMFRGMWGMGFVTSADFKDGRVLKFSVPLHQEDFRLFP